MFYSAFSCVSIYSTKFYWSLLIYFITSLADRMSTICSESCPCTKLLISSSKLSSFAGVKLLSLLSLTEGPFELTVGFYDWFWNDLCRANICSFNSWWLYRNLSLSCLTASYLKSLEFSCNYILTTKSLYFVIINFDLLTFQSKSATVLYASSTYARHTRRLSTSFASIF